MNNDILVAEKSNQRQTCGNCIHLNKAFNSQCILLLKAIKVDDKACSFIKYTPSQNLDFGLRRRVTDA